MPRVPDHVVQEIKDRVSIREVVEDYVQLKKDGANYKGLCPFHQEKTPSFKVNESRGIFKCFGCGEAGNIYGFLMKIEGMSFPEALEKLAGRAGITLPRVEEKPEEKAKREKSDIVFQANQAAATFYNEQLLRSAAAESARAYLQKREIGAETINRRRLGYAPDSWTDTLEAMKRMGIKEQDLLDAGLVIRHEEKGSLYDRFRGRLMFPIVDQRSRVRRPHPCRRSRPAQVHQQPGDGGVPEGLGLLRARHCQGRHPQARPRPDRGGLLRPDHPRPGRH